MELTHIAPLERWIELEQEIHARTGLDANVFDPKGYRITPVKNWANHLCPAIKETDKGQSFICAPAHMNIAAQAMRAGAPVIEECDAGMIKLVVPIRLNGEFLGAVGACGMRLEESEIDAYLVNKMTDIDEEAVERLSATVPPISREETEALGRHLATVVEEILAEFTRRTRLPS
jgi:ligand-binding sensor protein